MMDLVSPDSECLKDPGVTNPSTTPEQEDGLGCIFEQCFIRSCMTYPAELTLGGFFLADVNAVI